ncbi:MAG: prepilin-type N-terminal cleavage/methylation domain-containing protein, partial [Phycisphaerales bacterium]|nr:prepilin-type N-terminal cleavage/methylation domain-containing protein [Phycisphaerales bacterium]
MSTAPASTCVYAAGLAGQVTLRRRGGFTLIELILACVMMTILFSATYASLSQSIRSRDREVARTAAYTRAGLAADLIARDINNALRASDLFEAKVAIVREGRAGSGLDGLLLFTHIDRPVRPASGQPEGDECETQYRLEPMGVGSSADQARYA